MKWIGQHIYDFISRFRNDVYLEDLSTTTETNMLIADSDGKVSKRTMGSLTSGTVTVTDSTANTEFPVVFHNESDGLLDDTGSFTYNPSSQILTMISGVSNLPGILLENTNTDNKPPQIKFLKDKGVAGIDGDYTGSIAFYGDNSAQEETIFGMIRNVIETALDTDEAGRIEIFTATSQGGIGASGSMLQNVIKGTGHGTNGTVDVNLGYHADSTTTVAGNLVVTSDLTVSGTTTTINTTNLNVEDKNITLNYNASGDTSSTADLAGITIQDAVDASNDATLLWNASSDNWRLSHGLDITNGASGGVPALILDNDDVDEIALDINAENTTANIIDIDAQDLTTGSAIFIDSHSAGSKDIIDLDLDIPGAANNEYTRGLFMDIDKTGNVPTGEISYIHGVDVDFRDAGTNVGTSVFRGLYVKSTDVNTNGGNSRYGLHLHLTGGDVAQTYGVRSKVENGGIDLSLESSSSTTDWCRISTTTAGLTTIETQDGGSEGSGTDAHLLLDPDGDIILNPHTAKDIFFKENGTERIQWHLDSTPIMEVTGNFDIDCSGDINIDTDTGHFNISRYQDKMSWWDLSTTGNKNMSISHGPEDTSGNVTIRSTTRTGDNAGKHLNISGGAASASGNNKKGGNLTLQGGTGRGTDSTGEIYFQLRENGSTFGASGTDTINPEDAFKMGFEISGTVRNIFTVFEPGQDSDEYCRITVAEAGVSAIETYDDTGSNGANLTLDIDGDISLDAHTAKDIYFKENGTERFQFHLDSTPTMEVTGNFDLDCSGSITLDSATGSTTINSTTVDMNTSVVNILSTTSERPILRLDNRNADEAPPLFEFFKNVAGANNDYIGSVKWVGQNAQPETITYANMWTKINTGGAVDGDEAAVVQISVATSNDSTSNLRSGLNLTGTTTTDVVNANIGYSPSSLTTIAGDLKVDGEDIYSPTDGDLNLHSDGYMRFIVDEDNSGAGAYIWYAKGTPAIDKIIMTMAMDGMMDIGGVGATNPGINISNYANDTNGGALKFHKSRGLIASAGQDNDVIGTIEFNSYDDAPSVQTYAKIRSSIGDATHLDEAGKLSLLVATEAVIRAGVQVIGDGASSKVDVVLGFGTTSTTSLSGDLTIKGDNIATEDALTITPSGPFSVAGGSSEIDLTTSGTVDINAGLLDIDVTDDITIDAADNITLTTAGTDADGRISLVSGVASGNTAIHLDGNADAASIVKIDAGVLDVNATTYDLDATNIYITGTSNLIEGKTSIPKRAFGNPSDGAGNADGDIVHIGTNDGGAGGAATTAGKVYYYHSNGSWVATNSDDPGTATGLLAVALGTAPGTHGMLLRGTVDLADNIVGTEALGSILYLDKATAGAVTTAAPTATGDIVRVIGYALTTGDTNKIWFNPDNTWVEHV